MANVTQTTDRVTEVEQQKKLDKGLRLGERNYASNADVAARAKGVVSDCVVDQEGYHATRRSRWKDMERVYNLESLSENADSYGIHLGTVFAGTEEFAAKMAQTIFSGREYISGTPEDREYGNRAKAAVALVREQLKNELHLEDRAIPLFREAALKGCVVMKVVPSKRVVRTYRRPVDSRETDEGVQYIFSKPEEVEIADTRYVGYQVLAEDFRIPSTASSIEDAHWCGDFSYMTEQEIEDGAQRGIYEKAQWNKLKKQAAQSSSHKHQRRGAGNIVQHQDTADAGPHIDQYSIFEWWGEFDLKGDGVLRPCVITLAMKATTEGTHYSTATSEVLRITENPFFHQQKPYVSYRPLAREKEFWTKSPAECLANNSYYEDEMAMYALMAAALESSPPLEVGEDSGVLDDELDGFLPGKSYRVERTGQVGFVTPPARSGIGFQSAQFLSAQAKENAGLGKPANAPRVSAAGIMTDAQQLDLRTAAWVQGFESQFLKKIGELLHGYNRQFMTRERKLNVLGMDGINAEDIRVITPTDLAIDIRFEAIVGRTLLQQATQIQGLVNMMDRMMMMNQVNAQGGQPPAFDIQAVMWTILSEGFQIRDKNILTAAVDPMDMPTPQEEQVMFARGDRPEVQKGENLAAHAQAHIAFLRSENYQSWDEQKQQAFVDHIRETIDMLGRRAQQELPDIDEMLREALGKEPPQPTRPGFGQNSGGAGVAQPTQNPNSPAMRRPSPGMMQAPNNGAV